MRSKWVMWVNGFNGQHPNQLSHQDWKRHTDLIGKPEVPMGKSSPVPFTTSLRFIAGSELLRATPLLGHRVQTYDVVTRSCHVFTTKTDFGFWKSILVPFGCYPVLQRHKSARKPWPITSLLLSSRNVFQQKPTIIMASMGSKRKLHLTH
jgi:hypothetical protein